MRGLKEDAKVLDGQRHEAVDLMEELGLIAKGEVRDPCFLVVDQTGSETPLMVVLREAGWESVTVASLETALNKLSELPAEALLIDYDTAGVGAELVPELRSRGVRAALPVVVMLSGTPDTQIIEELLARGVSGICFKPLRIDTLRAYAERFVRPLSPRT